MAFGIAKLYLQLTSHIQSQQRNVPVPLKSQAKSCFNEATAKIESKPFKDSSLTDKHNKNPSLNVDAALQDQVR